MDCFTSNNPFLTPILGDTEFTLSDGVLVDGKQSWSGYKFPPTLQLRNDILEPRIKTLNEKYALRGWSTCNLKSRKSALLKWADLLDKNSERLAKLNCIETGRSFKSLKDDSFPKASETIRWFVSAIDHADTKLIKPGAALDSFALVFQEPIGLVLAILPWNDPVVTLVWKVVPALLTGNIVVVKPSEHAQFVIHEAILLLYQAGLSSEELMCVFGNGEVGDRLVNSTIFKAISFTGSTATAQKIGASAYKSGIKRITLECGGKGSFIFGQHEKTFGEFADVLSKNVFYNQGQICSASSIAHVPKKEISRLIDLLATKLKNYYPENPLTSGCNGYMISKEAVARVKNILSTIDEDCFVCTSKKEVLNQDTLWSIPPVILLDVDLGNAIWDTELFAPVLLVRSYENVNDAVEFVNSSQFGLANGIWSSRLDECMWLSSKLNCGMVHINSWGADPPGIPFGGIKNSGVGHEKSIETFKSYTTEKVIYYTSKL